MYETQKTPATNILRKPIPMPFVWIALILGFVLLFTGSPLAACRLIARAVIYGAIVLIIQACRKLFSWKKT
jgi:hypothetical protein